MCERETRLCHLLRLHSLSFVEITCYVCMNLSAQKRTTPTICVLGICYIGVRAMLYIAYIVAEEEACVHFFFYYIGAYYTVSYIYTYIYAVSYIYTYIYAIYKYIYAIYMLHML